MSDYYDIEVLKEGRKVGTSTYGKFVIAPAGTVIVVKLIHGSGGSLEKQRFTKAGGIRWIRHSIKYQARSEVVAVSESLVREFLTYASFWGWERHDSYGKRWRRLSEKSKVVTAGKGTLRCAFCEGSGKDPNSFIVHRPCQVCRGTGAVPISSLAKPGAQYSRKTSLSGGQRA